MVDGAVRGLGAQAMSAEVGIAGAEGPLELHTDSSAAKGFACRRGAGKARHVETRLLWLQQAVAERRIRVKKVRGSENPADLLTKSLGQDAVERIATQIGMELLVRPVA